MKKTFLLLAGIMSSLTPVIAQEYNALWHPVKGAVASATEQVLHPDKFIAYQVQEQALQSFLSSVSTNPDAARTMDLPAPDGTYQTFRIWQTPMMAEGLATRYPDIHTYTASAVSNPMITAKIDYTPFGFHAMVFNGAQTYFVDPYGRTADGNYLSYYKNDYPRPAGNTMSCEVKDKEQEELGITPSSLTGDGLPRMAYKLNGTTRRKYRLALACTGEYAVAVAGASPTKAAVLAKMVTSMNRVNGVYERELSYTMELISNTDAVIYLDGLADPFSNSSGNTMLTENQDNMNNVIGLSNFDIGHVFSTGGGGIAWKGSVCNTNRKAQGVTGRANPVGDAFDIDYVAHEIGHQFGGDHTFNYNSGGSCSGNAVQNYSYEPGSGSTIMAYGGICGNGSDYQSRSDAYFHSASLEQITTYIGTTNCAATSTSTNVNATMGAFNATYNIPSLTPFELTGPTATDGTADSMTYSWEQRDRALVGLDFGKLITATKTTGPLFRPYPPKTTPTRVFPRIESVILNTLSNSSEQVADTGRSMCFRLTQRDIYQGWGCWNVPTDSIRLNVIHTGVAFAVTSPSTPVTWGAGTTQLITWNVASTTAAPVSCANVDIFLSTDGGYTYPYTLISGTPNDGSQSVTMPNVNTTKMRIKVKGSGNVFFAISSTNAVVNNGVGVGPTPGNDQEVIVSPVPATDLVQIKVNNVNETLQGRIVNAVGQSVWQGAINTYIQVPVSTWAKGIYYLKVTSADGAFNANRTVVIQ